MFDKDEIQDEELETDVSDETEEETVDDDTDDDGEDLVSEDDDQEDVEDDDEEDDEGDALVINLDGEEDEEEDTVPIRSLRQANRDQKKRIRELEKQLEGQETPDDAQELGDKPTLEDFDYDQEKHAEALIEWNDRKRELDAKKEADTKKAEEAKEAYQNRFDAYQKAKAELKAKDFDEAEDVARENLSVVQQSVIIAHAKRPELVIYALGKNPEKAADLAKEEDPIAFAFKVAQLEANMKVTGTKKPKPEKRLKGGAPQPQVGSKKLDAAFKEAQKTGDFTKYQQLKRQKKAKG